MLNASTQVAVRTLVVISNPSLTWPTPNVASTFLISSVPSREVLVEDYFAG
jgi:hypothetical protein